MSTQSRKLCDIITTTAIASATKRVVSKVTSLVETECYKLSNLRDDVASMKRELDSMHALLKKPDGGGDDDAQVLVWRDEVCGLSDDIKACVADFESRIDGDEEDGGGRRRGDGVAAFFRENAHKVATVGARHSIGSRIKKLKARIEDINERAGGTISIDQL